MRLMPLNKHFVMFLTLIIFTSCNINKESKYGLVIDNFETKSQKKQLIDFLSYAQTKKENVIDKYEDISHLPNDMKKFYDDHVSIKDSIVGVFEILNITKKKNNYQKVGNKLRKKAIYFIDVSLISSNEKENFPEHIRLLSIDDTKSKCEKIKIGNKYLMTIYFYFDNDCCMSKKDKKSLYSRKTNELKYSLCLKYMVVYSDIMFNILFTN